MFGLSAQPFVPGMYVISAVGQPSMFRSGAELHDAVQNFRKLLSFCILGDPRNFGADAGTQITRHCLPCANTNAIVVKLCSRTHSLGLNDEVL